MRKPLYLLLIALFMVTLLVACKPSEQTVPTTPVDPDVASVEITNSNTNLSPGNYTLTGRALPEGANQQVRFTLLGAPSGISLTGSELTVSVNAEDKVTFTIRITSLYDPTKTSTKVFTVNNPEVFVEITTEAQLRAIGTATNGLNERYKLMNNIELTSAWIPLGTADIEEDNGNIIPGSYFNGLFDGQGFSITNIEVNGSFTVGFFAQIGSTGIVRNVHLQGEVNATGWSGGVAGINGGLITNVISEMDVTVIGTSAGAMVSVNRGTISYSYAIGKIMSGNTNLQARSAGLVAANEGQMIEVYGDRDKMTTPNYIAFTPTTNTSFMRSTATMKTAATFSEFNTNIWFIEDGFYPLLKHEGFVAPTEKEISLSITNDQTSVDVETTEELQVVVAIVNGTLETEIGYRLATAVTGVTLSATGLLSFTTDVVNLSTVTVEAYLITDETINASMTFTLIYNPIPIESTVYITTEADLVALATQTNAEALGKTYLLANDLTLENWYLFAIGSEATPFTGTFDGQGYTITGFKGGDGKHNFGMFGYIGSTGVVKNFNLLGAGRDADMYVGAAGAPIASVNHGLIENIYVEVTILSSGQWVAGFVANNFGTIQNVIVRSKVGRTDNMTIKGPGFAIDNEGTIENVYVDQTLTGAVTFFHAANATFDALLVTDAFLKTASSFTNFDDSVWNIVEGTIPMVKSSAVVATFETISNEAQLHALAASTDPALLAKEYRLTSNIVLEGWYLNAIGSEATPFTGIFDGQGYTISGFKGGDAKHDFGMFGHIGATGVVKNFNLLGADRPADLYVGAATGVIASKNYGLIENIYSQVTIMSTGQWVGGFVGDNYGTIRNVISRNSVGRFEVMGIKGPGFAIGNEGTIENEYVDQTLTGAVTFFHAANATFDALLVTDAFLKTASSFTNFDDSVWNIVEGTIPMVKVQE
ncbi:MAG: hypothetical protein Q7I99_03095 [Acholeplasmataceae bacterium]|nr:hypothetical protein [Acholeplasmataceae bacterium]